MKVLAICSGGLDSSVMYWYLQKEFRHEMSAIHFTYGSKHNARELQAAREVIPNLIEEYIRLPSGGSSLMDPMTAVPHGYYTDESMKSTVVPFRNGVMLAHAASWAVAKGCKGVSIGVHQGDHPIYPDCRAGFISAFQQAVYQGTDGEVTLIAPFVMYSKSQIVKIGHMMDLDEMMWKTWSCYEGEEKHCGKCGTCVERREAFQLAGIEDKTEYKDA